MNYAQYIDLAIVLIQEVLAEIKGTDKEQQLVANIQAAFDALMAVKGSDVTYAQLEALRVRKTWPDPAPPAS